MSDWLIERGKKKKNEERENRDSEMNGENFIKIVK